MLDAVEILRAGGGVEGLAQPVAGERMQTRTQLSVSVLRKTARVSLWTS
jgi:hypothetical protein